MKENKYDAHAREHGKKNNLFCRHILLLLTFRKSIIHYLIRLCKSIYLFFCTVAEQLKNTLLCIHIKIVFALELTNSECKYLLKKAGYTLASSSKYALIIRYFIENGIYDLSELNKTLIEYGFKDSVIS